MSWCRIWGSSRDSQAKISDFSSIGHRTVAPYIIKSIGVIKTVDIVVDVMLGHFVRFAVLKIAKDGVLSIFIW